MPARRQGRRSCARSTQRTIAKHTHGVARFARAPAINKQSGSKECMMGGAGASSRPAHNTIRARAGRARLAQRGLTHHMPCTGAHSSSESNVIFVAFCIGSMSRALSPYSLDAWRVAMMNEGDGDAGFSICCAESSVYGRCHAPRLPQLTLPPPHACVHFCLMRDTRAAGSRARTHGTRHTRTAHVTRRAPPSRAS